MLLQRRRRDPVLDIDDRGAQGLHRHALRSLWRVAQDPGVLRIDRDRQLAHRRRDGHRQRRGQPAGPDRDRVVLRLQRIELRHDWYGVQHQAPLRGSEERQ